MGAVTGKSDEPRGPSAAGVERVLGRVEPAPRDRRSAKAAKSRSRPDRPVSGSRAEPVTGPDGLVASARWLAGG
jgi:hypothetical protein